MPDTEYASTHQSFYWSAPEALWEKRISVRLGKERNSCLEDKMWCTDLLGRLKPECQPGQSSSSSPGWSGRAWVLLLKGAGLHEGGLWRDLLYVPLPLGMHFPPLLPGTNTNKVWGVTSFEKKKKKANDQIQASVCWKEEKCKIVQPDVSSNTTAGASAVSSSRKQNKKKGFPVSSSWQSTYRFSLNHFCNLQSNTYKSFSSVSFFFFLLFMIYDSHTERGREAET